jgi:hypothetical protein
MKMTWPPDPRGSSVSFESIDQRQTTLIKKKIKFSSYIRNSEWSSYEERLPNI